MLPIKSFRGLENLFYNTYLIAGAKVAYLTLFVNQRHQWIFNLAKLGGIADALLQHALSVSKVSVN